MVLGGKWINGHSFVLAATVSNRFEWIAVEKRQTRVDIDSHRTRINEKGKKRSAKEKKMEWLKGIPVGDDTDESAVGSPHRLGPRRSGEAIKQRHVIEGVFRSSVGGLRLPRPPPIGSRSASFRTQPPIADEFSMAPYPRDRLFSSLG